MKKIMTLMAVISLVIFILFSAGGCKEETTEESAEEATDEEEATEEDEEEVAESSDTYSGGPEDSKIAFVCASVGENWNINRHFPDLDIAVYA